MHNKWLDKEFIDQYKDDVQRWQVYVLMTGGVEVEVAEMRNWNARRFVDTLYYPAIQASMKSGVFPVIALGPTKVADRFQAQTLEFWDVLADKLDRSGIPYLDFRDIVVPAERFANGQRLEIVDRFVEGYFDFTQAIEATKKGQR